MPKISAFIILAICLILLGSCGGQATISNAEAIKAAKDEGGRLKVLPQLWHLSSGDRGWPDEPGSEVGRYVLCGQGGDNSFEACDPPMTYSTEASANGSAYIITFAARWQGMGGEKQHQWRFSVSNATHVSFLVEEGDSLPTK